MSCPPVVSVDKARACGGYIQVIYNIYIYMHYYYQLLLLYFYILCIYIIIYIHTYIYIVILYCIRIMFIHPMESNRSFIFRPDRPAIYLQDQEKAPVVSNWGHHFQWREQKKPLTYGCIT